MTKATQTEQAAKKAARKLSPELNEFLSMMKALEGQAPDHAPGVMR